MFLKLIVVFRIAKQMGIRYVLHRIFGEFEKTSGILKLKFPQNPPTKQFINLKEWRRSARPFFFLSRDDIAGHKFSVDRKRIERILRGEILFFGVQWINLGKNYDWISNPDNGYKYDGEQHWANVNEFSSEAGDIKYVWEKSRFCYLYDIIRHDQATGEDHSAFVFDEMLDWIRHNPINSGPNWISSQEISLRIMNWTFALYYYRNCNALTEELFQSVLQSMYWQMKHVFDNISFSRIAVRNNHAITETLSLYAAGILYPFFPGASEWKLNGKKWFEKEIVYQIYPDGSYLQFSMNYHRIVVQLLSWGIALAEINHERFRESVYHRAKLTLEFLCNCQDRITGYLPNYGANDGSMFFRLNDCDFRDFRPQLNALAYLINRESLYEEGPWDEDILWYNVGVVRHPIRHRFNEPPIGRFEIGGYYIMRDTDAMLFIRCGNHRDRPSQADNLHIDLWYKGKNLLYDGGSYKYNTSPELLRYFAGTQSHNTVMLGDLDQMEKGPRFIWFGWTQAQYAQLRETPEYFEFDGSIHAFRHLSQNIHHRRIIQRKKSKTEWKIIDTLEHETKLPMSQIWNLGYEFGSFFDIVAQDDAGRVLTPEKRLGWYSESYGQKTERTQLVYLSDGKKIVTTIAALSSNQENIL